MQIMCSHIVAMRRVFEVCSTRVVLLTGGVVGTILASNLSQFIVNKLWSFRKALSQRNCKKCSKSASGYTCSPPHGVFQAPLGSLDCTRKSYIPPCRGKFALSESTVSKFGKIFHAILLNSFQSLKAGFSEFKIELLPKLNLYTECNCSSKRSCSSPYLEFSL